MKPRAAVAAALIAAALLVFGSVAIKTRAARDLPNIVLVSLDGCPADAPLPALADRARRGVTFAQAYAQSDKSLYSHAALLTSLFPTEIGPLDPRRFAISAMTYSLPKVLNTYGWDTAAFTGGDALISAFGFEQGFNVFNSDKKDDGPLARSMPPALAWMRGSHQNKPFFLFIQGHDCDATPPRFNDANAALSSLFDELDREGLDASNTLVIVTADHANGTAPAQASGPRLPLACVHVPLVMFGWGIPSGGRVDVPVASIDILPTILTLVHIKLPANARGSDLSEFFKDSSSKEMASHTVYVQSQYGPTAVYHDGYVMVSPTWLNEAQVGTTTDLGLYDEKTDPSQTSNLLGQPAQAKVRDSLRDALAQASALSRRSEGPVLPHLTEAQKKNLQDHGYWMP